MNRLLAKEPRSSSGSRDASASSSASRWPFDIFEVSITEAASFEPGSFTPVSAFTCSGGASSGVFIELHLLAAVVAACLWQARRGADVNAEPSQRRPQGDGYSAPATARVHKTSFLF